MDSLPQLRPRHEHFVDHSLGQVRTVVKHRYQSVPGCRPAVFPVLRLPVYVDWSTLVAKFVCVFFVSSLFSRFLAILAVCFGLRLPAKVRLSNRPLALSVLFVWVSFGSKATQNRPPLVTLVVIVTWLAITAKKSFGFTPFLARSSAVDSQTVPKLIRPSAILLIFRLTIVVAAYLPITPTVARFVID